MTPAAREQLRASSVLIIGGGIAGLTAGVALADRGVRVFLLERDLWLGGRAASRSDAETGDIIDNGPHILLSSYANLLALLGRLGTRERVVFQAKADPFITMARGGSAMEIKASRLPAPAHFLPSLLGAPGIGLLDILSNWAVTASALSLDEDAVERLDAQDAWSFLVRSGVSARFIDWYWRFAAIAIMNASLESCSAGALMRFHREQVSNRSLRVGFPDGGLGELFAPGARRAIEAQGGRVILGFGVRRLVVEGDAVTGVELSTGQELRASQVIAALPPADLGAIIPPEAHPLSALRAAALSFKPVPYRSVYLWFDRKITSRRFWARTFAPGDLNCDFYDLSNIRRGWSERPSLIASNVIDAERSAHLNAAELIAATLGELTEFLPEARRARLLHARVHDLPMAIHAPRPGTERLRPPTLTAMRGLVLAGDWLKTGLPACMESAARSGFMAAQEVLAALGHPKRLAISPAHPVGIARLYRALPRLFAAVGPSRLLRAIGQARLRRITASLTKAQEES